MTLSHPLLSCNEMSFCLLWYFSCLQSFCFLYAGSKTRFYKVLLISALYTVGYSAGFRCGYLESMQCDGLMVDSLLICNPRGSATGHTDFSWFLLHPMELSSASKWIHSLCMRNSRGTTVNNQLPHLSKLRNWDCKNFSVARGAGYLPFSAKP